MGGWISPEAIAHIVVTLCIFVSTVWSFAAAYYSRSASRESKQANDAVNHRHLTGTPRLYDLALKNDERLFELLLWKRSYDGGPLDEGKKVLDFVNETEKRLKQLEEKESSNDKA